MHLQSNISIVAVDLDCPSHGSALIDLLDHYARDPMGGATPLSAESRERLIACLAARTDFLAFLAYDHDKAVGLINCFEGFSTFAARPLLNVHDIAVRDSHRGKGIGGRLIAAAEAAAKARNCCKLTLEVLSNNTQAIAAYRRAGFKPYELDPAAGQALFMHKWL